MKFFWNFFHNQWAWNGGEELFFLLKNILYQHIYQLNWQKILLSSRCLMCFQFQYIKVGIFWIFNHCNRFYTITWIGTYGNSNCKWLTPWMGSDFWEKSWNTMSLSTIHIYFYYFYWFRKKCMVVIRYSLISHISFCLPLSNQATNDDKVRNLTLTSILPKNS